MARSAQMNVFEEGRERVESALKDVEKDWSRLQRDAEKRRKAFERRAERELKKFQADLRKNPWVKRAERQRKQFVRRAEDLGDEIRNSDLVQRAEAFREDAERAIDEQVENLFDTLRIAHAGDVGRLERKVSALNRKVSTLEKRKPAARKKTAKKKTARKRSRAA